jgi:hypothetical protein
MAIGLRETRRKFFNRRYNRSHLHLTFARSSNPFIRTDMKKASLLAVLVMAATGAMAQPPPPPPPITGAPFDVVAGVILIASIGYAIYTLSRSKQAAKA